MRAFHAFIHPAPDPLPLGRLVAVEDEAFRSLALRSQDLPQGLSLSFEEVQKRLETLPRMHFEPDGSFVWRAEQGWAIWQMDGMLYDHDNRLTFVELKGRGTNEALDQLFGCCGWPESQLVFQLPQYAVFLDEREFRRYAC